MEPRFLLMADVAEQLNVSTSQVYHMVRSGELPAIKVGGRGQWRIERASSRSTSSASTPRPPSGCAPTRSSSAPTTTRSRKAPTSSFSAFSCFTAPLILRLPMFALTCVRRVLERKRQTKANARIGGTVMAPTTTPARPRRRPRTGRPGAAPRSLRGRRAGAPRAAAGPAVRGDPGAPAGPAGRPAWTSCPATGWRSPARRRPRPPAPAARPRRPTTRPPPPHAAAQRFVGMCVEILNGYRPAAHLRQVTHPKHCTAVTDQLTRRTVRVRMPPSHAARQGHLVRVRRMLLSEPLPGVAELVVVLEQGPAVWAMAVRLERPARPAPGLSTWLCTLRPGGLKLRCAHRGRAAGAPVLNSHSPSHRPDTGQDGSSPPSSPSFHGWPSDSGDPHRPTSRAGGSPLLSGPGDEADRDPGAPSGGAAGVPGFHPGPSARPRPRPVRGQPE